MKNKDLVTGGSQPATERIDPFKASIDALLVVAFGKSSSRSFPIALSIAQAASKYGVFEIGGSQLHLAIFGRTQEDAGRAHALLGLAAPWKSTMVFCRGQLLAKTSSVENVLSCYLDSFSCESQSAHCHKIIDDPMAMRPRSAYATIFTAADGTIQSSRPKQFEIKRMALPCKLLHWTVIDRNHTATPEEQIQAGGVKAGVHVCPRFRPNDYQQAGTSIVTYF